EGARAKLEAYELWRWFEEAPGAFGEDAPRREELLPVAWKRARERGMHGSRVIVIGDTPADVRTARVGAELLGPGAPEVLAVAVRTGFATDESLEESAPDLLLENLEVGLEALLAMVFDERAAR
ncbi:MAG: hypothetical protein QGG40_11265, partial [Myxococcota bacterium]|nr:hypothetical protein [Myxococcota bacterium]